MRKALADYGEEYLAAGIMPSSDMMVAMDITRPMPADTLMRAKDPVSEWNNGVPIL